MMDEEQYIREVRSRLTGMDSRVKEDIVRELRTHVADLVRTHGGNVQAAMFSLERPADVAKRYKQLYGYAMPFRILFVLIAGAMAVPTMPVLSVSGDEVLVPILVTLIFLSLLVVFLLYVAVTAGRTAGLGAGLAACLVRIIIFGLLFAAGGESVVAQGGGVGLFFVVSILLVLIGWIPGEAKVRWTKPSGEL